VKAEAAMRPRLFIADRVHTFADAQHAGSPTAILVRGDRVAAVGPAAELRAAAPGAALIDLTGSTVTPGLIDSHIHLTEWALARRDLDLSDQDSPDAIGAAVANRLERSADAWIRGRGWNPHRWGGALPERTALDRRTGSRPVVLQSHDMHALWVNGAALERAGIDDTTADPEGGRIVRDAVGRATGVLLDYAAQLVTAVLPQPTEGGTADAVADAQAALHAWGITGVHALPAIHVVEPEPFGLLERLRVDGRLRLRVLQHIALERLDETVAQGRVSGDGDARVRVGALKMFLDGALGSRTAWMREPYEESDATGIRVLEPALFRSLVERAAAAGIASVVHAIGDAAVDLAFDVLGDPRLRVDAMPHRIEHVQCCPAHRLGEAGRLGVTCSVQPAHLRTDWRIADRHWGPDRAARTYAFRSLLDAGAWLAFGSDAPVEPADPRLGLHAALTRTDAAGDPAGGWFAAERLNIEEALTGYTLDAARAAGGWGGGAVRVGAPADFVAWNGDPLAMVPDEILEIECVAAVVGGDVVHGG
jgi:predicted amidohydrolase YtcJ